MNINERLGALHAALGEKMARREILKEEFEKIESEIDRLDTGIAMQLGAIELAKIIAMEDREEEGE